MPVVDRTVHVEVISQLSLGICQLPHRHRLPTWRPVVRAQQTAERRRIPNSVGKFPRIGGVQCVGITNVVPCGRRVDTTPGRWGKVGVGD